MTGEREKKRRVKVSFGGETRSSTAEKELTVNDSVGDGDISSENLSGDLKVEKRDESISSRLGN